ncbi:MAG: substrate-binding domain-containing protein [Clostridia bacterium]|nr:substrate-binding domain-containing protein [Clostridia bacterium]
MKRLSWLALCLVLVFGLLFVIGVQAKKPKKDFRFVIIPKVVHPWFDLVHQGAEAQAKLLSEQTGCKFRIDYRAPSKADVVMQNMILEQAAATRPDGIAIDLLDADGNRAVLQEIINQGIPVVIFDSEPPEGMGLTSIGNDFAEQAAIASERLVELLGGKGKVAIMQGVPTAPNHRIRYEAHKAVFAKYPGTAHPDLKGFVSCDAAGPIGIGLAIKEAGKTGKVLSVGLDNLNQLLALIKEGVVESSSSTKPEMQGAWSVMALWMQALGQPTPKKIDTGILIITKDSLK